jgi:catechol 2,3-dioxygenase-like lactoylglutathione lyase family enzyme
MTDRQWRLQRLFHINITCSNLDASVEFYRKLGYEVRNYVYEDSFAQGGQGSATMGMDGGTFRGCILYSPGPRGHALLDLIEWIDPKSPPPPPVNGNSPGIPRIAIWIKNLEAAYEDLVAQGLTFHGGLQGPDREHGIERVAFVRDPDGLIVELIEFPESWRPPAVEESLRADDPARLTGISAP